MGMMGQFFIPILIGGTACIYPLTSTATQHGIPISPTAENAIENAKRTNATGIMTVPAFILEWQSPEDIAYLKTLNLLVGIFEPERLRMFRVLSDICRSTTRTSSWRFFVQPGS
jgi:aromatic ring hydroxylase